MRLGLALAALAVLFPGAAGAHVTIAPPFVEVGAETEISFATPNERPPHATTSLRVTAPAGIAVVSAAAPAGWQVSVAGSTVTWAGGRLEQDQTASFPLRVLADLPAGTYAFSAAQRYDDGESVARTADLAVLPAAAKETAGSGRRIAAAVALAGAVAVAAILGALRLTRRRSLQDQ